MTKRIIHILWVNILFAANIEAVSGQLAADSIKYIIEKEVANRRSMSIIVGVIDSSSQKIINAAGRMSAKNSELPDGNTVYEIGSITKVFTSLLLADMVIKKELSLNDPISKFLPAAVKTPTRNGKEITLLDLATQTSGLPRMPGNMNPKDPANPYADYTIDQFYTFLSNYTLTRDIGSKYEYSNYGVGLLGNILSSVAGKDYETLVIERICKVLNMKSTVIVLNEKQKNRLAIGHDGVGNAVSNWDFLTFAGAGALRSTMNDMLIFAAANLGLVKTKLDSAIQLTHIIRASRGDSNLTIGLGWHISAKYSRLILWHNGGTGGYRTFLGFDKVSKTAVVVLSNSTNNVDDIALHVLNKNDALQPYQYLWAIKDTISAIFYKKGIDTAIKQYYALKKAAGYGLIFNEDQLNNFGYELLHAKKIKEAMMIFKLNVQEYPKSANVYDSLGEAYMADGNNKLAIENYQKSVSINPENTNGVEMLKKLNAK